MRNWIHFTLLLLGAAGAGCHRKGVPAGDPGSAGTGVGILGGGGNGGQGATGVGGAAGIPAACSGASDERLVIADQRILRLTARQTLNTIRYLINDTEAAALVTDGLISGDVADLQRRFPPLEANGDIDGTVFAGVEQVAQHVADYVLANFTTVTACAPADDTCATTYLGKLAARAYRRQLTPEEQTRFRAMFTGLRSPQTVNGYLVTFTVEEATSYAVQALLTSPQMLWRWEIGQPAMASTAPVGVPLTDAELASHLAFFLTDQPPDDALRAAANGTLRTNLAAHVDALLATQASRDWLRTIIETYLTVNQLPAASIDPTVFPTFTAALAQDMGTETRKFLDNALWNGLLTDLLLSRTAFLNSSLAVNVYGVPAPAGATASTFVQTTLPADQRSGLLTNAGFLTIRSRPDGSALAVPRGMFIASVVLCMPDPGEFGVALDNYDGIGRFRTVDDMGRPIDAHTRLPAAIGGDAVANGVELAQKLATKPAFTNCLARALLQYAMVDRTTNVEVPLPPQQAGCATADVVKRYQDADGKTFTDLVRATAAAPAFVLRRAAP